MPDVRITVIDQLAEGDMVATRLHITGTPVADYGTVKASEGKFDVHALALFRLHDGLAAEEWFFVDGGSGRDRGRGSAPS